MEVKGQTLVPVTLLGRSSAYAVEVQQVIEQKQMFIAAGYMMSIFSLVALTTLCGSSSSSSSSSSSRTRWKLHGTESLKNLTVRQLGKKFPAFYVNWKVHYRFHNGSPIVCILSEINPDHALQTYLFNVHLNIILLPMFSSSMWCLAFRVTITLHGSFPHMSHIPNLSNSA